MRVIIISDMEGVAGIVNWNQVSAGKDGYQEGRHLYTEEINAAVRGAKAAGAKEILVMDHHGAGGDYNFNSLIPDALDPDCEFVVQSEWTEYTEFLEEGCDACLLIGMHAMAGTPDGVMCHTVSGQNWTNLRFNEVLIGETGINAALCGNWDCPVALVTGDVATCKEAEALLGEGITTVAVKKGIGRFSARNFPAVRAREMIEAAAKDSLKNLKRLKPYDPGRPCTIEVEFTTPEALVPFGRKPHVEVTSPRSLTSTADDWWTAWQNFYF